MCVRVYDSMRILDLLVLCSAFRVALLSHAVTCMDIGSSKPLSVFANLMSPGPIITGTSAKISQAAQYATANSSIIPLTSRKRNRRVSHSSPAVTHRNARQQRAKLRGGACAINTKLHSFVSDKMVRTLLRLAGSVLFSFIFLTSGLNALSNWDQMATFTASKMQPLGVPNELIAASFAISIALKILGAVLLVAGVFNSTLRKVGAGILIAFLVPVALIVHNFWEQPEGQAKQTEMSQFFKNLSMIGALLCFIADADNHGATKRAPSKREDKAIRKPPKKVE